MGVPQSEDVPGEEVATPNVDVATAGEVGMDTNREWNINDVGKEDYGSDEDICKAYIRVM